MDLFADFKEEMSGDNYKIRYGTKIQRTGKIFSYTFWRTECEGEVFWSVQGNNYDGSAFIITQYFGPEEEAKRYQQEITLHHPEEKKIKMIYYASCVNGMNCINISRTIVNHFKDKQNVLHFEYRIVKLKRRPYPHRML
ncbi:uncharacterized protein LOC126881133 [Diabrotica virgifera virgifera]|uniref:Uncharacterized protein LOC114342271 n=1 Tax=Diabrotica virgifera virgifera TaxID=50390 RepID=A0A6P7GYK1_DIAVI|nr:uncharacterized protein LOC126881133 [Diabrotica virgifera virgifera]XP_050501154.1 uncharacterized protein LOC126881133 [Diabrotica virgifera virgifera]XP_050501155.1 uncharacterized protein LOC126881133 [Diabrotica virgifera virgifera]